MLGLEERLWEERVAGRMGGAWSQMSGTLKEELERILNGI